MGNVLNGNITGQKWDMIASVGKRFAMNMSENVLVTLMIVKRRKNIVRLLSNNARGRKNTVKHGRQLVSKKTTVRSMTGSQRGWSVQI